MKKRYADYLAFVNEKLSPSSDRDVRSDLRLCLTLDKNGYVYSPQDEANE